MDQNLNEPLPGRNYFVITWCQEGLESIVDISAIYREEQEAEKSIMWNILSESTKPRPKVIRNRINEIIGQLKLRARVNSQRHYEIYMVMTDESITKSDLEEQFNIDPQSIVDTIRDVGVKIFCERDKSSRIKIT